MHLSILLSNSRTISLSPLEESYLLSTPDFLLSMILLVATILLSDCDMLNVFFTGCKSLEFKRSNSSDTGVESILPLPETNLSFVEFSEFDLDMTFAATLADVFLGLTKSLSEGLGTRLLYDLDVLMVFFLCIDDVIILSNIERYSFLDAFE